MDWRSVRFDWNRARAFLVTAEEGSFTAAAKALGMAQPTIGRQVAALEAELEVTLFERVGNGLELTAAGLDLVEHVRSMGEAANRVSLTAAGRSLAVAGPVCISASEITALYLLPPFFARLRAEYPAVELELVASNTPSDLLRREADIAVRNFRPTDPGLVARKVGESRARLYAAKAYLSRIGDPRTPADLSGADFIGFDRSDMLIDGLGRLGLSLTQSNFPIVSQNQMVQWTLTRAGLGIAIMLEEIGDAEPAVRRVLPDLPAIPAPIWLTCHRELQTSRRIRVVFDLLAEVLGEGPAGR